MARAGGDADNLAGWLLAGETSPLRETLRQHAKANAARSEGAAINLSICYTHYFRTRANITSVILSTSRIRKRTTQDPTVFGRRVFVGGTTATAIGQTRYLLRWWLLGGSILFKLRCRGKIPERRYGPLFIDPFGSFNFIRRGIPLVE